MTKQMSLVNNGFNLSPKRTRKHEFLDEMHRVMPWPDLTMLIEPRYPKGKTGRPPLGIATMLRIHFMQQWFGFSDPAMEDGLHDTLMYREFAGLDAGTPTSRLSLFVADRRTENELAQQTTGLARIA